MNWNFRAQYDNYHFSSIYFNITNYYIILTIPKSNNYPNDIETNSLSLSSAAVLNII